MNYAIMRSKKLQTLGGVVAALEHNFRERETPNADKQKTQNNHHRAEVGTTSTAQAVSKLRELLPAKRRKDAVLAVEYLMTASPEWWTKATIQQQQAFFDQSMQWVIDKYGSQNLIAATIHVDEKTPHLSVFVAPITTDGRLSAKEYIGNRKLMKDDQTKFAIRVSDLGLKRGIEGSKATHQRVQQHYGQVDRAFSNRMTLPEYLLQPQHQFETPADIANRIANTFHRHFAPFIEQAAVSGQNARRATEMQKTALDMAESEKALQGRLNEAEMMIVPLKELKRLDEQFFGQTMWAVQQRLRVLLPEIAAQADAMKAATQPRKGPSM